MNQNECVQILNSQFNSFLMSGGNKEKTLEKFGEMMQTIEKSNNRNFSTNYLIELLTRMTSIFITMRGRNLGEKKQYADYTILNPDMAFHALIAFYIIPLGQNPKINDVRNQYRTVLNFLNEFVDPEPGDNMLLSEESIINIFNNKRCMETLKIISSKKPLTILNLNVKHREYNSMFLDNLNIIINSINNNSLNGSMDPARVFVHELGHAFLKCTTGSTKILPEGFEAAFNEIFRGKVKNIRHADPSEIFADCFSFYILNETEHSKDNFLENNFPVISQIMIDEYFDNLIRGL